VTARAATDRAFANRILNAWTSSHDSLVSRVTLSSFCHGSLSVPTVLGVLLASSNSCLIVSNGFANVE